MRKSKDSKRKSRASSKLNGSKSDCIVCKFCLSEEDLKCENCLNV